MPISEPLKVSISPKAMRSEWWISPTGGVMSPAVSNAHPKAHMAVAIMSWSRFISCVIISPMPFGQEIQTIQTKGIRF